MDQSTVSKLTLSRLVRIWWCLSWRLVVITCLPTLVVTLGALPAMRAYGVNAIAWVQGLGTLAWVASVPLSMWVVHAVLTKKFSDFSIRLIDHRVRSG